MEVFVIVISIVIGSGVFIFFGFIDINVFFFGVVFVIWFVGGVLVWIGVSIMVELGIVIFGEGKFRLVG